MGHKPEDVSRLEPLPSWAAPEERCRFNRASGDLTDRVMHLRVSHDCQTQVPGLLGLTRLEKARGAPRSGKLSAIGGECGIEKEEMN